MYEGTEEDRKACQQGEDQGCFRQLEDICEEGRTRNWMPELKQLLLSIAYRHPSVCYCLI